MFGETPVELGLAGMEDELLARFAADARYQRMFAEAFPDDDRSDHPRQHRAGARVVRAHADLRQRAVRPLRQRPRRQRHVRRRRSAAAQLFFSERLECFHCHGGFNFTDVGDLRTATQFDEIAVPQQRPLQHRRQGRYPPDNTGVFEITQRAGGHGQLQGADAAQHRADRAVHARRQHRHARRGASITTPPAGARSPTGRTPATAAQNPFKSGFIRGFRSPSRRRQDVLNFLKSLTDEDFVTNPRFSDPFTAAACTGDCNLDRSGHRRRAGCRRQRRARRGAAGGLRRRRCRRRRRGGGHRAGDRGQPRPGQLPSHRFRQQH